MAAATIRDLNPQLDLAPDGAPKSHIVMTQQRTSLIDVVLISNPNFHMKIDPKKFDPAVHVKATSPAPVKRERVRPPAFTTEPMNELLTFQMKRLRDMPEYRLIQTPSSNKTELVRQILDIRREYGK